ncbi:PP2C family protein-serine/threonine phosphatase [Noviherbaspirillum pedocola]|uniref:Serine/threonine-protein phosphatase n=1 Tax=Noviherbaspirillum pedocola TaxID=2801341 RepID=A0A934W6M8_9BURK|nr:protein phosphatase 2C domain-containing protein [Noviherbaspirillum pedocola]MBK4735310.1 serine/threonine-protein phosphatase [Noviherbaspirillum pedocola]
MAHANSLRWLSASRSHPGAVREINEDALLDCPERGLWAVADGMGGHSRGDMASRVTIDTLEHMPAAPGLTQAVAEVHERLQSVNHQLQMEAALRDVGTIGTTVVVLLAANHRCAYLWVGDSRIYRFRDGQLTQLTSDHSVVGELVARGALSPQDAASHPARNLITRAIGAMEPLDAEDGLVDVSAGDMFLLCSDGLSNEVGNEEIARLLACHDCHRAAEGLVDLALAHGGRDNVSVVVIMAEDVAAQESTVLNPAV